MASAQNNTIPASQRILEIDPTTTQSDLSTLKKPSERKSPKKSVQMSLFPTVKVDDSELIIMLRSLDLENLTPLQAFDTLKKLKEKERIIGAEKMKFKFQPITDPHEQETKE